MYVVAKKRNRRLHRAAAGLHRKVGDALPTLIVLPAWAGGLIFGTSTAVPGFLEAGIAVGAVALTYATVTCASYGYVRRIWEDKIDAASAALSHLRALADRDQNQRILAMLPHLEHDLDMIALALHDARRVETRLRDSTPTAFQYQTWMPYLQEIGTGTVALADGDLGLDMKGHRGTTNDPLSEWFVWADPAARHRIGAELTELAARYTDIDEALAAWTEQVDAHRAAVEKLLELTGAADKVGPALALAPVHATREILAMRRSAVALPARTQVQHRIDEALAYRDIAVVEADRQLAALEPVTR